MPRATVDLHADAHTLPGRQHRERRQICRRLRQAVCVRHEKPLVAGNYESAIPCLDVLRGREESCEPFDDLVGVLDRGSAVADATTRRYDTTLRAISMTIGTPNPNCSLRASRIAFTTCS